MIHSLLILGTAQGSSVQFLMPVKPQITSDNDFPPRPCGPPKGKEKNIANKENGTENCVPSKQSLHLLTEKNALPLLVG